MIVLKYVCEIISRRRFDSFFVNLSDFWFIIVYFVVFRKEVYYRILVEYNDLLRKMVCIFCEGGNVFIFMFYGIKR